MCLAYEPLRESLWILRRRFVDRKLPLPIAKAYIYLFLFGLGYLHSERKVVHAGECVCRHSSGPFLGNKDLTGRLDLKLGNILMSFENENILTNSNDDNRCNAKLIGRAAGISTAVII